MSAAKTVLPEVCNAQRAANKQHARMMALLPGALVSMRGNVTSKPKVSNAHHRSVARTLSPHAELSGPAAGHPWRLEDPRGGVRGVGQRAGQQRDVFFNAGSRRNAYRCSAPFR